MKYLRVEWERKYYLYKIEDDTIQPQDLVVMTQGQTGRVLKVFDTNPVHWYKPETIRKA